MAKRCVSYFNCFQDRFVEIWKSREAEEHAVDELGQLFQGAGGRIGVLLLQRGHQPGDVREQLEKENSLLQKWLQIMCRALTHTPGNKSHPPRQKGQSTGVDFRPILDFILHPMNSTSTTLLTSAVQMQ